MSECGGLGVGGMHLSECVCVCVFVRSSEPPGRCVSPELHIDACGGGGKHVFEGIGGRGRTGGQGGARIIHGFVT